MPRARRTAARFCRRGHPVLRRVARAVRLGTAARGGSPRRGLAPEGAAKAAAPQRRDPETVTVCGRLLRRPASRGKPQPAPGVRSWPSGPARRRCALETVEKVVTSPGATGCAVPLETVEKVVTSPGATGCAVPLDALHVRLRLMVDTLASPDAWHRSPGTALWTAEDEDISQER